MLLKDPHPRVRYALCNALGQMSTDFTVIAFLPSLPFLFFFLSLKSGMKCRGTECFSHVVSLFLVSL